MERVAMTKMSLYAFFATFALGMAAMVFSRNVFLGSEPAVAAPSAVSGISGADAGVGMDAFASGNPLKLPDSAEAEYGGKGGWEHSGTVNANFVSARAQLDSWMQNQGWIPDKKITLDENIEPRILLTFTRGAEEMTLFVWKISTMSTGFAYRRESANKKISANEFK